MQCFIVLGQKLTENEQILKPDIQDKKLFHSIADAYADAIKYDKDETILEIRFNNSKQLLQVIEAFCNGDKDNIAWDVTIVRIIRIYNEK